MKRGVRAILIQYEAADESVREVGRGWYPAALSLCERISGGRIPADRVARALAVLSPRAMWRTNVQWTETITGAYLAGEALPSVSTMSNRHKAWRELDGEDALSGQKTTAFAKAILGDHDAIVIDSWILRVMGLKPDAKVTPLRQRWITAAFHEAARITGETPRDLQAIVWCAVRGRSA